MVYVEYNTSKRQEISYGIDVVESLSHDGYTYLPYAPLTTVQPNINLYPVSVSFIKLFGPSELI